MLPADLTGGNRREPTGHLLPSRLVQPAVVQELCLSVPDRAAGCRSCCHCALSALQVVIVASATPLVLGQDLGSESKAGSGNSPQSCASDTMGMKLLPGNQCGDLVHCGSPFPILQAVTRIMSPEAG